MNLKPKTAIQVSVWFNGGGKFQRSVNHFLLFSITAWGFFSPWNLLRTVLNALLTWLVPCSTAFFFPMHSQRPTCYFCGIPWQINSVFLSRSAPGGSSFIIHGSMRLILVVSFHLQWLFKGRKLSICSMLLYIDNRSSLFSHLIWLSTPDSTGSRLVLQIEDMNTQVVCFLFYLQVKVQLNSIH